MFSRRSLLAASFGPGLPLAEKIILRLPKAEIVSADWSDGIDAPVQPGSLWKPFLAAAYNGPAPRFHCDGKQCWLGRRHGWLDMPGALAQSCNQWFHQLYKTLPQPLRLLHLPDPPNDDWPNWTCSPQQIVYAYAELLARRADYPLVVAGLRQSAEQGTAKALGRNWLAKTGTGPSKHHSGDGWVVAAHPADSPTKLILYRQRGTTGAQAASALARSLANVTR
jgi:cell division protein FtsI/penicillin-binding protein 2